MLSYFKYYIIKTQQARKSIVLKLCGYAAAFMPDVGGSHKWEGVGGVRGVEISLVAGARCCRVLRSVDVTRIFSFCILRFCVFSVSVKSR